MKILSVGIAAYNAEKYLNKIMTTLLDKRILDDVEIIIVDDGSTDGTAQIADDYKSGYPDVVKVIHQENGGHGSAINSCIQAVTGKYVYLSDADDWVDTENYVKLIQYMKKCESDLIVADMVTVDSDDKVLQGGGIKGLKGKKVVDAGKIKNLPSFREVLLDDYLGKQIPLFGMHNYFIRNTVLQKANVRCHCHHFYIDTEYVLYSLWYAKTVTYVDWTICRYWLGRDGQSVAMESRRKNHGQYMDVADWLVAYYNQNKDKLTENQCRFYVRYINNHIQGIYAVLLSYNNKVKKEEMIAYDQKLKMQSADVYYANENLCIQLLRYSRFKLYKLTALIYQLVEM